MRWALVALLALAAPGAADAQLFFSTKADPPFEIGPLTVRASVKPKLGPVQVDVQFSLDFPATQSPAAFEQDLFLLWPGGLAADPTQGPPEPALEQYLKDRNLTVIESGRVRLSARNLYRVESGSAEIVPGGASFVSYVREGGALGISSPATWIHIPWDPRMANRVYLMSLRLNARNLIRDKPATWVERAFWGRRYRVALSYNETRQRAVFPMYFQHRDRVVRLSNEPAQLVINFADADHLRIDEMFPQSARRQLSETLQSTDTVSTFLDRTESLVPQALTVQFGYFTRLQSWAPVLIPTLFFVLGNVAGVLVRNVAERLGKHWAGRLLFARGAQPPPVRQTGVVLDRETLGRIVPGTTTYDDVLRLCGPDVEEHSRLAEPERRTLFYRGRRIVPQRRRALGWFATIDHWDAEEHEVEIDLERNVVRDVQARVRRSRLSAPAPA